MPKMREKFLSFYCTRNDDRTTKLIVVMVIGSDDILERSGNNQICKHGPLIQIERLPLIFCPHHLRRRYAEDMFAGLIPMRNQMIAVDSERRYGAAIKEFGYLRF